MTTVLKSAKISGNLLLQDSNDPIVASSNIPVSAGCWDAASATITAEQELQFQKVRGHVQFGKGGLGLSKSTTVPEKGTQKYRQLLSKTSRKIDEEVCLAEALALQVQGQWCAWENYIKQDFSWKDLLAFPPNLLSFCLRATYDVLPSPSNLKRWHISTVSECFLCKKQVCTTAHILTGCSTALEQGRFTFRHNQVLKQLDAGIREFISQLPSQNVQKFQQIKFVKAGTKVTHSKKTPVTGLLHLSDDWKLVVDLEDSNYVFPPHLAISELPPDLVIYSNNTKRAISVL